MTRGSWSQFSVASASSASMHDEVDSHFSSRHEPLSAAEEFAARACSPRFLEVEQHVSPGGGGRRRSGTPQRLLNLLARGKASAGSGCGDGGCAPLPSAPPLAGGTTFSSSLLDESSHSHSPEEFSSGGGKMSKLRSSVRDELSSLACTPQASLISLLLSQRKGVNGCQGDDSECDGGAINVLDMASEMRKNAVILMNDHSQFVRLQSDMRSSGLFTGMGLQQLMPQIINERIADHHQSLATKSCPTSIPLHAQSGTFHRDFSQGGKLNSFIESSMRFLEYEKTQPRLGEGGALSA